MSNDKSKKEWIQLKNGNLIIFLHHHLPFLQATSKVQWNALKGFFKLLDVVFTKNNTNDEIRFKMSRKNIAKYGTGKHFNKYLEAFFIDENFYYGTDSNEPKTYFTLYFLSNFIISSQKYLIKKMGIDDYMRPLKIDFNTPIIKKAYSVIFSQSSLLDKSCINITKVMFDAGVYNRDLVRDNHPIVTDVKYIDSQLDSDLKILKQADLVSFYGFTDREAREKSQKGEIYTFDTKKDVFKPKLLSLSSLRNEIYTRIVLDATEVDKLLNESINKHSLKLILFYNIKHYYVENTNYLVYKEVSKRMYALSQSNIINFQGLSKDIRQKLFKGLWQYDLEAAAPTILCQIYKKFHPTKSIDILESYIKNRNALRIGCAKYLVKKFSMVYKNAYKNVKELINALFYGADIDNKYSTVALGYQERQALKENVTVFKDFLAETQQFSKGIYDYLLTNFKEDDKINYNGYIINLIEFLPNGTAKKKSVASVLSHIYYYHEKEILDIVFEKYKNDLILLLHDGFIIDKEIDTKELEESIYSKLKLKIKYEKEEL